MPKTTIYELHAELRRISEMKKWLHNCMDFEMSNKESDKPTYYGEVISLLSEYEAMILNLKIEV